jgi:hypothetical protein
MKISDIESYNLDSAVQFHDELNGALFKDSKLQADVRSQLMEIAADFEEFMGLSHLKVVDVRLYGSNAAYTYTSHSDIDLHLLVDMSAISDSDVYRELFTSKKTIYNMQHKITVRGLDVELYIQDASDVVRSLGEYSVKDDKWIKFPVKRTAKIDTPDVAQKFEKLAAVARLALRSNNLEAINSVIDTVKRYRAAGLEKGGEFSSENISYKSLRSSGLVDQLYRKRDRLRGKSLSIDEESGTAPLVSPDVSDIFESFERYLKKTEFDFSDVPSYDDYHNNQQIQHDYGQKILRHCWDLEMSSGPLYAELYENIWKRKFEFCESAEVNTLNELLEAAFGEGLPAAEIKAGMTVDIVEVQQRAVHLAGINLIESIEIAEVRHTKDGHAMFMSTAGEIYNTQYESQKVILKLVTEPGVASEGLTYIMLKCVDDAKGNHTYDGWTIDFPGESFATRFSRRFNESQLAECSGYIPSESEKSDPRWERALSVDVRPDTMKKSAIALGLGNIARDGRPQVSRTDGKFRK